VLDNIQYPSELLQSKLGDCDDCTVLYCSLLENLNIPTAFVDAPAHILMMFDSGVTTQRAFGLRLDEDRYILRGDRFWIPVEVTKLGEGSFMEAWELGMKICRRLEAEGGLRITDVREVWAQYPYVLPTVDGEVQLPDAEGLERFFLSNVAEFHRLREDYVKRRYILRLIENPDDHVRRIELAQTKIESEDYNDAITAVLPLLHSDYQDYANYLIGCADAGQDDFETAAQYFERALEQDPGNPNYERGLEVLKAWIQRQKGGIAR
jgi:tetratricopeptide (TPR) repeat protein